MIPSTLPPPAAGQATPETSSRPASSSSTNRFSPALQRAQRSFDEAAEPETISPGDIGLVDETDQGEPAEVESEPLDSQDGKNLSPTQQSIGLPGALVDLAQPDLKVLDPRSVPITAQVSPSTPEATVDEGEAEETSPTTSVHTTERAGDASKATRPDAPSPGGETFAASAASAADAAASGQPAPPAPQPSTPRRQSRPEAVGDTSATTIVGAPTPHRTTTTNKTIDRAEPTGPAGGIGVAIDRLLGVTNRPEPSTNQTVPAASSPETTSTSVVGALPDDVAEQLWGQVERALHRVRETAGGHELRLRLRPAELGELSIRVQTNDHGVTIHLVASNPAAQQALESDANRLRAELANAGFGNSSVDVSQRDDGHQPGSSMHRDTGDQRRPVTRTDGSETGYHPTAVQTFGRIRQGSSVNLTL